MVVDTFTGDADRELDVVKFENAASSVLSRSPNVVKLVLRTGPRALGCQKMGNTVPAWSSKAYPPPHMLESVVCENQIMTSIFAAMFHCAVFRIILKV